MIYFDNNASTRISDDVYEAMKPFFGELYANPSSSHRFGGSVRKAVEDARARVAKLIGAEPDEIVFTGSGTEADNSAIMSALESNPSKKHIITTAVEHHAVLNLCRNLSNKGYRITYLPVDSLGAMDLKELENAICDDTAVVSIMYANNETGVLFPVGEIAKIAKKKGVTFHTDAVQAVGKVPIDVKAMDVDMLSLSGHKLHAPKGVGMLYVRGGIDFFPYLIGGHQERGRRAGTENVASIVGLGMACETAMKNLASEAEYIRNLRDRLEAGILKNCPDSRINGDRVNRLPNTANIGFGYVEGEAILVRLDMKGICASSGSACTAGSVEPSHVLRAMKVPVDFVHGSIRFSFGKYNTQAEVDEALAVIPEIIKVLVEMSPFGKGIQRL